MTTYETATWQQDLAEEDRHTPQRLSPGWAQEEGQKRADPAVARKAEPVLVLAGQDMDEDRVLTNQDMYSTQGHEVPKDIHHSL